MTDTPTVDERIKLNQDADPGLSAEERELDRTQRLSRAHNHALRTLQEAHLQEFNTTKVAEARRLGILDWTPRKTKAELAREALDVLVDENPHLEEVLLARLQERIAERNAGGDPDRTTDLSGDPVGEDPDRTTDLDGEPVGDDDDAEWEAAAPETAPAPEATPAAPVDDSTPARAIVVGFVRQGRLTADGLNFVWFVGDRPQRTSEFTLVSDDTPLGKAATPEPVPGD